MHLLLQNPLWIVLIVITVALHVGFAVMVRRWMREPEPKPTEPHEPHEPPDPPEPKPPEE
jgi:hypothetical protein